MGANQLRVGTVNYACQSGLGILTKSFYDAGIVTDMFIVEHSRHPTCWEWYPQTTPRCPARELDGYARGLRRFVDDLDVLFCFETPFYWPVVDYAKSRGVKTVLMPMYECSLTNPPATFDEYWCPSLLDLRYFSEMHMPEGEQVPPFEACHGVYGSVSRFTPVPVKVEWRQRTEARVFIHNAGHGGLKGRNGTRELLHAMRYVKSDVRLVIRSQESLGDVLNASYPKTTIQEGTLDSPWKNGGSGDVFIFPEKFNGLSLPLQEARASGMLVMATNRYPMNSWLPTEVPTPSGAVDLLSGPEGDILNPLIPVVTTVRNRIGPPYMEFDEVTINPRMIAEKIDEWYGRDISVYSSQGKEWAKSMSWETLGPKYRTLLEDLK